MRAAAEPTREYAAAVVAVEASCALLAMPATFWAKALGDKQVKSPSGLSRPAPFSLGRSWCTPLAQEKSAPCARLSSPKYLSGGLQGSLLPFKSVLFKICI